MPRDLLADASVKREPRDLLETAPSISSRARLFAEQLRNDGFATSMSDDELMSRAQEMARQNPTGRIRTRPASEIDAPTHQLLGPVSRSPSIDNGWSGRAQAASIATIDTVNELPLAGDAMRSVVGGVNRALGGDESTLAPIGDTLDIAKRDAAEVHPNSTFAGDVAGFSAGPGQIIYKGGARIGAPIFNQVAKRVAGSGIGPRLTRYGTRLAGLGVVGAAEVAGAEATQGARNEGLISGVEPTLEDRIDRGQDALQTPLNYLGLPLASLGYRALRGAGTKLTGFGTGTGASLTPRNVQRQVEGATGGAVPANATIADAIAELNAGLFGENMGRRAIKDFGHLTTALRNADIPDQRIVEGFRNIAAKDIPPGDRRDLTRLLEQEFAEDFPGVIPNLREFLLKVGIEGQSEIQQVLRNRSNDLRRSQADELRSVAQSELGSQSRLEAGDEITDQLRDIGGDYDRLLAAAPRDTEAALEAAELALRSPELTDALAAQARNAGIDVETLVLRNPFAALHWVQSQINDPALRATRNSMQDLLERNVPGYKALRDEYHRVATARDALGYYDQQTGRYVPGMGDRLAGRGNALTGGARNELGADHLAREYQRLSEFDDQATAAADLSFRDVITDPLRGTRATGLDNFGQDVAGARLGAMQTEGITESLPQILGQRGERLSNTIRQTLDERQYLADIDPRGGSNTANKLQAAGGGAKPLSEGLGRISTDDGAAAIADAALVLSGNLPFVTLARRGAPGVARAFQPQAGTQARIAERLTRPLDGGVPSNALSTFVDNTSDSLGNALNPMSPQGIRDLAGITPQGTRRNALADFLRLGDNEEGSIDPRLLGLRPPDPASEALASATENPTRNGVGRMMAQQKRNGSLPIVRLIQDENGRVIGFDGSRYTHADYAELIGLDPTRVGRAVVEGTPQDPRNLQWFDANDRPWSYRSRANRNPDEIMGEAINDPRLSPMQNRLVSMRRAGMTNAELAEFEDTTVNVVKSQLSQARRRAPDIEITRRQGGIRGDVQPIIRELTERYPDMTSAQIAERASARLGRTIKPNTVASIRSRINSGDMQGLEEGFIDPELLTASFRGPVTGAMTGGTAGAFAPWETPEELRRNIFVGAGLGALTGGSVAYLRNNALSHTLIDSDLPLPPPPLRNHLNPAANEMSQASRALELRESGLNDQQIARELALSLDQVAALLRGAPPPRIYHYSPDQPPALRLD